MGKAANRKVTLAPQAATQAAIKFLQGSLTTPANVVGGPVNLALAGKLLGVQAAPTAPTAPRRVSARTAQTWARSVPAANKGNVLLPKVHANFAPAQTITVLVNNPKAQGKAPAARFAIYGGQGATLTVAAYLAACGKRNIAASVTHADLMWDFNHQYINVA